MMGISVVGTTVFIENEKSEVLTHILEKYGFVTFKVAEGIYVVSNVPPKFIMNLINAVLSYKMGK